MVWRFSIWRCASAAAASGSFRPTTRRSNFGCTRQGQQPEGADLQRFLVEAADFECLGRAAGAAVADEMAEGRERPQAAAQRRLAHRVEHQADAASVRQPIDLACEVYLA